MAIAEASRASIYLSLSLSFSVSLSLSLSFSVKLSVSHPLLCLHTAYSRTEVGSEVVVTKEIIYILSAMLKASMVLLFMTLLVQGQECDQTNLFQLKRNIRELGNQTALSELSAISEVSCPDGITSCPCPNFDVNSNNCKATDDDGNVLADCDDIPIAGESDYDENNPGALSDGCWNIPEGGCTQDSNYTTGKTDTTNSTNNPTLCIKLPDKVCPSRVCVKTGNGGAGKVCYDTDGVTCKADQEDATQNECESWITTSGSFCIVAPEFTKKNGNPGNLQGISNFAIQWKCGDCGSGSVSTTTALDPQQPTTSTGGAAGDPHMRTIDGEKYLLLQQGSFNFWRFSGLDAEVHSAGTVMRIPLDFRVFTHYSGHQSYTKSLLLVDQSGPDHAKHSSLEITSEDCIWRSKTAKGAWHTVEKPTLVSNLDGEVSAMRLGLSIEPHEKMHVDFLVKENNILRQIAKILVICKPGLHINTKLVMFQKEDFKYVTGQLGIHKDKAILLQDSSKLGSLQRKGHRVRTDTPFLTTQSWTDLGGSGLAAAYLSQVDDERPAMFSVGCDKEKEDNAKVLCAKQLDGIRHSEIEDIMAECVFDVCRGGGEVAAELFAEIYTAQ